MPLNLADFLAELRHHGTHPHNRFIVNIVPPPKLDVNLSERQWSLRAAYAQFPGRTLMTKDDILRYGFGQIDKVAHNTLYDNVPVSFVIDNQYDLGRDFHQWIDIIQNSDQSSSEHTKYLIEYKDNYATEIEIVQYNAHNDRTISCVLHDAFPTNVGETQLGWDQNDSFTVLPVTFAYTSYTMD